jgi:hypothetical protein
MDEGSAPLVPNEDGTTIREATTPIDDDGGGTYKTPTK